MTALAIDTRLDDLLPMACMLEAARRSAMATKDRDLLSMIEVRQTELRGAVKRFDENLDRLAQDAPPQS